LGAGKKELWDRYFLGRESGTSFLSPGIHSLASREVARISLFASFWIL
jgi:hypothetical protein